MKSHKKIRKNEKNVGPCGAKSAAKCGPNLRHEKSRKNEKNVVTKSHARVLSDTLLIFGLSPGGVTKSHEKSRRVTESHGESRKVTESHGKSCHGKSWKITESHEKSRKIIKIHEKSRKITKSHGKSRNVRESHGSHGMPVGFPGLPAGGGKY